MEQQEELAGAERGEGEMAGAPPDPAPIMEILPLADVPAEEEDTQAPVVDVDDPPAADPPAGLHLNPTWSGGSRRPLQMLLLGGEFPDSRGVLLSLLPHNPLRPLAPSPSSGSPPGSGQNPMSVCLPLPSLWPPLEEGVACRGWSTPVPTLAGTPPLLSYVSVTTC